MGVLNAVETIIGTIKFKRGLKENLPTLKYGEPAYAYDENELYIGGKDGDEIVNKKITRNSEVAANTEAINNLTESVADNTASLKDLANLNLFINGGFSVWQRGTSFSTNGYT
ncbi:hyaluronate lyase N-terminal domain-containing protein, partial [Clostridium neonatale]